MYVAKDEGSGIEKELDSDQTKIMEEGGKKKKTMQMYYLSCPKTILLGHFK